MIILGTGGSDHDFAAAIVIDGELVAAVEEERLSRIRHGRTAWYEVPVRASVTHCLNRAGLELTDVDAIYSNQHLEKQARFIKNREVNYIGHHLSHAACTFLTSPYQRSTIVVIDGAGHRLSGTADEVELETISLGSGDGNQLRIENFQSGRRNIATCSWRYMCSNSIGAFYEAITQVIGFGSYGAGKTMGLAPYGEHNLTKTMRDFVRILPSGQFEFDPYGGIFDWSVELIRRSNNPFMIRANLAASAQLIFEDALMNVLNHAHAMHPSDTLCLSGGCGLNPVANSKIRSRTNFRDVFVHPATDDGGTAIGAALFGWYCDLRNPREPAEISSIGSLAYSPIAYSDSDCLAALDAAPLYYYRPVDLFADVAQRIALNGLAGWFQGGSEIGPRALGNRSILANPLNPRVRDHINLNVKHRESFRPLAPVVTEELVGRYFDLDEKSPFMLTVATVKAKYRDILSSVTHVDGSARVQTVNDRENSRLYALLQKMQERTGHSILLNTSFNPPGAPIVESPHDAVQAFLAMDLDFLVLGDYIAEKHTPWATRKVGLA